MPTPKKKAARDRESARKAVIDEYGQLDSELALVRPKQRRFEELAKIIREWHIASTAGLTIIETGLRYTVVIGPKAETTLMAEGQALYEALGHERFIALAKITLGALDAALTAPEVTALTRKERTGTRTLKAIPAA